MAASSAREDYGIDAPGAVRGLGLGGTLFVAIGAAAALSQGRVRISPDLLDTAQRNGFWIGAWLLLASLWMLASSRWLKARVMRRLLAMRAWRGDEAVLDVGCGRGLVAIGAARRLDRGGSVRGVDIWQARDLSENSPARATANARAAGVAQRVTFDTGDARKLPYADASFDVVASMTAIHNISGAAGRDTAIAEMVRVVRPGGQILLFDIRYARRYARLLRDSGASVRTSGPILLWGIFGLRIAATREG